MTASTEKRRSLSVSAADTAAGLMLVAVLMPMVAASIAVSDNSLVALAFVPFGLLFGPRITRRVGERLTRAGETTTKKWVWAAATALTLGLPAGYLLFGGELALAATYAALLAVLSAMQLHLYYLRARAEARLG